MASTTRLSAQERRDSIIQAVRCLCANKGFNGTTTRELAEAAGVSEALLFRHFPTKEALFQAIQQTFCDDVGREQIERLNALEPSTQTLVLLVHFLVSRVMGKESEREDRGVKNRMVLRSLAEDGDFARVLLEPLTANYLPKVEESLRAAVEAGDAQNGITVPNLGGWFVYNLAAMCSFEAAPEPPIIDFGQSHRKLVSQIVSFALRGLGLKESSIRRHYKPEALSILGF